MIWTDEQFQNEALVFLNKEWRFFDTKYTFDINSLAMKYILKNDEFKYKDDVETGVLVNCLVSFGYVEFIEKINGNRYYSMTKKGIEFIESKKNEKK